MSNSIQTTFKKNSVNTIFYGFIAAGVMNFFGALVFSKFFTNLALIEADPVVMSRFGLVCILLWGLAYFAVSKSYQENKWIVGVFFLEKVVYVIAWINWLLNNELLSLYKKDILAGVFYSIYGVNDFVFAMFFLWVFVFLNYKNDGSITKII